MMVHEKSRIALVNNGQEPLLQEKQLLHDKITLKLFHVLAGNEDPAIDLIYSQEVVQRNHLSSGINRAKRPVVIYVE